MKSIKNFKYKNTHEYDVFLKNYDYTLDDVIGFSVSFKKCYHGNILTTYNIYFKDGEYEYFKTVCFKNFNEYRQSKLGFNGNKLLEWCDDSNIIKYKVKDIYGAHDRYVTTK